VIETVPVGTTLTAMLNGRPLGIVESNVEHAFSYWGQRQRDAERNRKAAGEGRSRTYALVADNGNVYRFIDGQWRAA
jgi:hypothetical protein